MQVRQADVQDAEQIAQIWNREIREGTATFNSVEKPLDEVVEVITARGSAFQVAEKDERLLGFATYFPFRGGVGYAATKEHSIFLDPAAQGLGAGRLLLEHLCDTAKEAGVHSMMAGISAENQSGVRFHTVLGFSHVARVPRVGFKFDRYIDLILMQKFL